LNSSSKRKRSEHDDWIARLRRVCAREFQWNHHLFSRVLFEYLRFMTLKANVKDTGGDKPLRLSPGRLVDCLWHMHILDSYHYARFCAQIAEENGCFFHHDPLGNCDENKIERNARVATTCLAYRARYDGEKPPTDIWGVEFNEDFADAARSEEDAKEAKVPNSAIRILLEDNVGNRLQWKLQSQKPFLYALEASLAHFGYELNAVAFIGPDGWPISPTKRCTPANFGLRDNDKISVMERQCGC